jgi:site-specific DNA-methyltransferase (adenine-specific)
MSSARTGVGRDDWCTPECVLERVRKVGRIELDPCDNAQSIVGAASSWMGSGLEWTWRGLAFCNPPYSTLRRWLAKCAEEARGGVEIIALVPARTDTRAWHESATTARAVCFWRGRITFVGAPHPAPFPSAVLYWGPSGKLGVFTSAFDGAGAIYTRPLSRQDV